MAAPSPSSYAGSLVSASRAARPSATSALPRRWLAQRPRAPTRTSPHHLAQRRSYAADAPAAASSRPVGFARQYNALKAAQEQIDKHGKQPSMPGMSAEMQTLPLQGGW